MQVMEKLKDWLRPSPAETAGRSLFFAVMANARAVEFYEQGGVADTVDGQFDLLVVHLILTMRRLKSEGPEGEELSQRLLNTAFANFDEALREMGVGDLTVPKKVRKMAEAFYGRVKAYEDALAAGDGAVTEALRRNLYRGHEVNEPSLAWTCDRLRAFESLLKATPREELLRGAISVTNA